MNNLANVFARMRNSLEYRTGIHVKSSRRDSEVPATDLFKAPWYYAVELLPEQITQGLYPLDLPNIPRLMLRRCQLAGMSCLDMGTMEGLIPVLMARGGAAQVVATDCSDYCVEKLEAVQHHYQVDFEYKTVGLMYDFDKNFPGRSFDLIHCSGLLYHVFSPLNVLCGVRPLLKRNGLMIVSTNVIAQEGFTMDFNNGGRMQEEKNTFWYISIQLFDYLLRFMKLRPIDCIFVPHTAVKTAYKVVFDKPSGYLSVLCRAADDVIPTVDDPWMRDLPAFSCEHQWSVDWELAGRQPVSSIKTKGEINREFFRKDIDALDLWEAVKGSEPVTTAVRPQDTHLLRLADYE